MKVSSEASGLMVMAGKDIDLLRYIVSSDPIADEIFGFHAQQAVEKSLKAWIYLAGGTFDWVHDVRILLIALQDMGLDVEQYRELIPLNSFAVQFRYEAMDQEDVPLDRSDTLCKVEALYKHVQSLLAKAEA
jgi:HEPN domain-containing protein